MNQRICSACGQAIPSAKGRRVCSDCLRPISRHHKWHIGGDFKLHHNDCQNPEQYPVSAEQTMPLIAETPQP